MAIFSWPSDPEALLRLIEEVDSDYSEDDFDGHVDDNELLQELEDSGDDECEGKIMSQENLGCDGIENGNGPSEDLHASDGGRNESDDSDVQRERGRVCDQSDCSSTSTV